MGRIVSRAADRHILCCTSFATAVSAASVKRNLAQLSSTQRSPADASVQSCWWCNQDLQQLHPIAAAAAAGSCRRFAPRLRRADAQSRSACTEDEL